MKKKKEVQPLRPEVAIYPIGVAARLLDVHPRTLRIYEAEGLIKPAHKGTRRVFSPNDIEWISCLRSIIHDQGISIPGVKKLMKLLPCWEIAECDCQGGCSAAIDWAVPRNLYTVGDEEGKRAAKALDKEEQVVRSLPGKKQVSPG